MSDLAYVRAWQRAARGRSVELVGFDAKAGVVLRAGARVARYTSVAAAAVALAAGYVRWRAAARVPTNAKLWPRRVGHAVKLLPGV